MYSSLVTDLGLSPQVWLFLSLLSFVTLFFKFSRFWSVRNLDLLLDVSDNIAPGLTWPPQQTTICVLGPSIPSSIHSAIEMFRDEFLVHIKEGGCPYE